MHVRRIEPALRWIDQLLGEENVPFVRTVRAIRPKPKATRITDASTWGLGGVLVVDGLPVSFFSTPIPMEFINHTKAMPGDPKHMTHYACF